MNKQEKYEKSYNQYISDIELMMSIHSMDEYKNHFKECWDLGIQPNKAISLLFKTEIG